MLRALASGPLLPAYLLFGEVLSPWAWGAVAVLAISLALSNLGSARAIRARAAR